MSGARQSTTDGRVSSGRTARRSQSASGHRDAATRQENGAEGHGLAAMLLVFATAAGVFLWQATTYVWSKRSPGRSAATTRRRWSWRYQPSKRDAGFRWSQSRWTDARQRPSPRARRMATADADGKVSISASAVRLRGARPPHPRGASSEPSIDVITLGVTDLESARRFYEHGLGCVLAEQSSDRVAFHLGTEASTLALRPWDALASDAGVPAQSSGFRGFTLSYIVDTAAQVDALLARVARSGGAVAKPPRNAVWGYSAYVTDPAGHLWKIASAKRRPLLARNGSHADHDAIPAREAPITIAVADLPRAKRFYQQGLGLTARKDYRKFVSLDGGEHASDLAMYTREALARDAAVPASGTGFRGFALGHIADSAQHVDALLNSAALAGATIVTPGHSTHGDGYSGSFTDPDGCLWQITTRN